MARKGKIDEIYDLSAIERQQARVIELLEQTIKIVNEFPKIKVTLEGAEKTADVVDGINKMSDASKNAAKEVMTLDKANQVLLSTIKESENNWRRIAGSIENNVSTLVGFQKELKEVQLQIKEHNKNMEAYGSRTATASKHLVELKVREAELKAAISEANLVIKSQVKEMNAAEGSTVALSQQLLQMQKTYEALSSEERSGSIGKTLAEDIRILDLEVKKLDASLGKHQRNVGNYASGWNGLGNSINQITRELPAFTYSMQTGFMAISNNLPILFDEIARTRVQIAKLRAEGQKVPGLFRQIAGSVLSWGTALSVGVMLLTVYGKEIGTFFSNLFKGKKVINDTVESQRLLNDTLKESSGSYGAAVKSITELRSNIELAKKGLLDKNDVLKQYNEGLGKTIGEVKNLDEAEKSLVENGEAYVRMMMYKAAANLALEEAAKAAMEQERIRQKETIEFARNTDEMAKGLGSGFGNTLVPGVGSYQQNVAEANRRLAATKRKQALEKEAGDERKTFEDIAKKFQEDAARIAKDYGFDFFSDLRKKETTDKTFKEGDAIRKANFEVQKQILEDRIRANDLIVQSDEEMFLNRTEAAKKYLAAQQALAKLEYEYSISDINAREEGEKVSAAKEFKNVRERQKAIQYITESAKAERLAAEAKYRSKQQQINDDYDRSYLKKLRDFLEKDAAEREKHEERLQKIREAELKVDYDRELAELNKSFANKTISEKMYNSERLRLQMEYHAELLRIQIQYAEKQLKIQEEIAAANGNEADFARVKEARIRLANLQNQLASLIASFQIKKNKEVTDEEEKEWKKRYELLQKYGKEFVKVFSSISDIANISTQKELNRIQEQIDKLEQKKKLEIDTADATIASEQEKAAKITAIEAKANAQRQALELRQRHARQRQAQWEKAMNVASIIQETAVAVIRALGMKPWTPANIALAAGVGALGAAQAAIAAATPIPRYATGTKDHKGGLAIVGDGGKKELVQTPAGKSYVTPDKPTLISMPKHSKVFPDADAVMEGLKISAFRSMPVEKVNEVNYSREMTKAITSELQNVSSAIKRKKEVTISVTRYGVYLEQKKDLSFVRWLNGNMQS